MGRGILTSPIHNPDHHPYPPCRRDVTSGVCDFHTSNSTNFSLSLRTLLHFPPDIANAQTQHHAIRPAEVTLGRSHHSSARSPCVSCFYPPCTDKRHTLSKAIMMFIRFPPCKAQNTNRARFAHPPPYIHLAPCKQTSSLSSPHGARALLRRPALQLVLVL